LWYHLSFNFFSTLAALRVKKVDMIIADAPSLWSGLPLLVKAIFPGVPYVYVVHDIYPDVMVNLGVLHNPSMVRWIEQIENFFYKKCAKVSVLSTGFKENLIHKGVPAEKIEVVPVCVDVDFIHPLDGENQLREKWGLKDKYVVLYAGNMGLSQGLENVIKAAQLLKNHAEIEFILVGEGATRQELQQMIAQLDLHNVQMFSFLPREEVPWLYDLADVGLVSLKKGIVVESVPSKTYSIMAGGRPFIATVDRDTEIGHLIDEAQCGLWVEPENPEALARAVLQIYEDQASGLEMGKRARNFVVEHFSRQVAANQYQQMIVQRVNGRRK
jgi:colanic acid biosynthesis glycosyl transferase WcaI